VGKRIIKNFIKSPEVQFPLHWQPIMHSQVHYPQEIMYGKGMIIAHIPDTNANSPFVLF